MRKLIIPALAVAVSVFSAFVTKPTAQLFKFNGVSTDWEDRVDPAMYSTATPEGCSGTPAVLCSLTAEPDGTSGHPLIGSSGTLYNNLRNGATSQPVFTGGITGKP